MKTYTVLCELDGKPLRTFTCPVQAAAFAYGRRIKVTKTVSKKVTHSQAFKHVCELVEEAPF